MKFGSSSLTIPIRAVNTAGKSACCRWVGVLLLWRWRGWAGWPCFRRAPWRCQCAASVALKPGQASPAAAASSAHMLSKEVFYYAESGQVQSADRRYKSAVPRSLTVVW